MASSSIAIPDMPVETPQIPLKDDESQRSSAQEAQKVSGKEAEAQKKVEEDKNLAKKMCTILQQTIERIKPICERITEVRTQEPLLYEALNREITADMSPFV